MTGPEHYRAAEKLLKQVAEALNKPVPPAALIVLLDLAHGHAALAHTAATAQNLRGAARDWDEVLTNRPTPWKG